MILNEKIIDDYPDAGSPEGSSITLLHIDLSPPWKTACVRKTNWQRNPN